MASLWYNSELSDLEKVGLRSDQNGVHLWCERLEKRFKLTETRSLKALTSLSYTPQDVQDGKRPGTYVSQTIRYAKAAGFEKTSQQLLFTWNHIDPDLRQFVMKPNSGMKITNFIENLEDLCETWELKYQRKLDKLKQGMEKRRLESPQQGTLGKPNFGNHGYTYSPKSPY